MATKQLGDHRSCPLLACPREIRDLIYAKTLLDFPTPTRDSLLECALPVLYEDGGDFGPGSWKYRTRDDWENYGLFQEHASECLENTQNIETNILLTNRQIFAEAKEMILRRGRLVKVTATNVSLSWRLCASKLCLIDAKYSSLCIMTHQLQNNCPRHRVPDYVPGHISEFVLCGRDVEAFCRAIMGDLAFILRPQSCAAIRHTLAFTNNFHEEHARSSFLARHTAHRQSLRPFRKYLRGFSDVSLVGISKVLAATALRDFRSRLIPDPDELLSEVNNIILQYTKFCFNDSAEFGSLAPLEKGIDLCIRATRNSNVWIGVQRQASDPVAFVEELMMKAYQLLVIRQAVHCEYTKRHYRRHEVSDSELDGVSVDISPATQTYEMCLVLARHFDVPGWTPDPVLERRLNIRVAEDIAMYMVMESEMGELLAIGYKAAQRALELEPDDEESKERMEWYDVRKRMAIQTSSFYNIVDGVLEDKGMTWWTGLRPESEYAVVLAVD